MKLTERFQLGFQVLENRMVMAPMTRSRALNNIPNDLMAVYYRQRNGAGLIITEGTAPSPNALGYPRIPGIFNKEQTNGWKRITDEVHKSRCKIFVQLMHTGRVAHPDNMPEGARVLAPSSVPLSGTMYTDENGEQPYPTATPMTMNDIEHTIREYRVASANAMIAGFDGVEIHGANGYLVDQFLNPCTNKRDDSYGGSTENRCRFALEVAKAIGEEIGFDKLGIRLSPYGVFNDMESFEDIENTYVYLAEELGSLGLCYIHIVDHSSMGAPEVPWRIKSLIRNAFGRPVIASGGFDKEKAERFLEEEKAELISFARPFLANPDLVYRFKEGIALNEPDPETFYTPGKKGYTDYPFADD
ncbi:alkene reductase [Robertkochia aurantiaca]|uniref:alkene reductase n=1 Tax=Robertkochia aurantiaca TaxID=2873700 RepID=UPI001CCEF71B|nr:alkene reductase [Robertkochia sp. 3YJGBD-33]